MALSMDAWTANGSVAYFTVHMFNIIPTGFIPDQDNDSIFINLQAAQGTSQVATNIVDVNKGARLTGSASAQVLSSAQSLSGESQRLRLEVGKFLDTVRAA